MSRVPLSSQAAMDTAPPPPPPPPRPGGGRVLGSAASASSASPSPSGRSLSLPFSTARISPSASSVSLNSDFESRGGNVMGTRHGGGSVGGDALICPICSEEMVTLLQLNQHLDDIHKEVEEIEKDDISTWFRKRIIKAKSFQPVAVLNQKLKGLDVFESNETSHHATQLAASASAGSVPEDRDPDYLVTRSHWQRSTADDYCLDPACRKPLGAVNGSVNCRKCGRLFCEEHTMYQIKLSRSAQHEPVRGYWCRVCETCYKSREGYNDHRGLMRDHTNEFAQIRRKTVDRAYLEVTRLEKRLTKLTQLLTNPPNTIPNNTGFLKAVTSVRNQRRFLEQSVVAWEDDANVTHCPHCRQTFSQFSLRKSHCRLCGHVVCGDPRTGCSTEVGLNVSAITDTLSEKTLNEMSLDVRICKDCKSTVFSKRDFALDLAKCGPDVRAYQTLIQFEQGIKNMMPRFQKLLSALQDPYKTPTPAQLSEATRTRKKLLDTFAQYDAVAKRILNLFTTSPTQKRLQKSVHQAASQFLHLNMLPLKALPKLLSKNSRTRNNPGNGNNPSSSRALTMTVSSSNCSSIAENEEKDLKEQLMVLEEQKFMVNEMLADANKHRRFDEVQALGQSLDDLEVEVVRVTGLLDALESREGMAMR